METARTIESARKAVSKARSEGRSIGFVPTMGALHAGHISLIKAAANKCEFVVVSIFVNPTQFGPSEDLDKYPRDLNSDSGICEQAGVDLIFAPEINEIYPDISSTWVNVERLTDNLCGRSRQGHFRGVTTVCTKLFNITGADIAFFGQKDAQQVIVIKRMIADLNIPVEIVICPTVRESGGLAVSSRNRYLSEDEKQDARLLFTSLQTCEKMIAEGIRNSKELINAMREVISKSPIIEIEYISIADVENLEDIEVVKGMALVALAVKVGSTRLIDNVIVNLNIQ